MLTTRTYDVESERVGVGYHRFARANAESTLPLLARCVIASSVSAPRIACISSVRYMIISKFNGRARAYRDSRDWRASGTRRRHRVKARDGASRILLNARLPRERRRQRPRRTPRHEVRKPARALLLVAEARPRAWRVRTSCRARRRDFIHDPSIPLFSFPSGVSLCVRRVSLSLSLSRPFSRRLLRARVSKDSRRRAGPPER